jgi:hypothetical protein
MSPVHQRLQDLPLDRQSHRVTGIKNVVNAPANRRNFPNFPALFPPTLPLQFAVSHTVPVAVRPVIARQAINCGVGSTGLCSKVRVCTHCLFAQFTPSNSLSI